MQVFSMCDNIQSKTSRVAEIYVNVSNVKNALVTKGKTC